MTTKAIEVHETGGMSMTGEGIELYRLLTIKRGLKFERMGMRLTRGPKMTTILRKQYGLKGNRDKLEAQLDAMIEACQARCQEQNAQAEVEQAECEGRLN